MKILQSATRDRGETTMLFADPDQVTFLTDKTVLNELNVKIQEDPNYPLPEGYFKVVDRQMNMRYEIPYYL